MTPTLHAEPHKDQPMTRAHYLIPKTERTLWKAKSGTIMENDNKGGNKPIGILHGEAIEAVTSDVYKRGHVDGFDTGVIVGVVATSTLGMIAFALVWVLA
jgi:hypothetical protein